MSDKTPVGYYRLTEAAEKYRERAYGPDPSAGFTDADLRDENRRAIYQRASAEGTKQFEGTVEAILSALREGEFEAEIVGPSLKPEFRILPSEWQGNGFPERMLISDTILTFSSDNLAKFEGRTPFISQTVFNAWLDATIPDLLAASRWGVLPTVVWIATRDRRLAAYASRPGASFHQKCIGITLRKEIAAQRGETIDWPLDSLEAAWAQLAEAMGEEKITAFATHVECKRLGGFSQNTPGIVFPPKDAPGAALEHLIEDRNGIAALVPAGVVMAHSWTEWHNPTFAKSKILGLWREQTQSIAIWDLSIAIWDFAEKHQPNDSSKIERMVTDIYASFWKNEFGTAGLKLLQDNGTKPGPETFELLTRFDLALSALGEKELSKLGEQEAYRFLASWNMADYRKINPHYLYQFVREKSTEHKRGLYADEAELEKWHLNWPHKIAAKSQNQHNKQSNEDDIGHPPHFVPEEAIPTPPQSNVKTKKPRPAKKVDLAMKAISALWPTEYPSSLSKDDRDLKINDWCKQNGHKVTLSPRTILTAIQKLNR